MLWDILGYIEDCDRMGKTVLGTEKIILTLPCRWMPKLKAVMDTYGALTVQDVIRAILASTLFPEEFIVEKKAKT